MASIGNQIRDFIIEKRGGMEVLLAVDPEDGTLHNDFHKETDVSRSTIQSRLDEAVELHLFFESRDLQDHGNAKRYRLTYLGTYIRAALESVNLDTLYDKKLEILDELESNKEVVSDWINDQDVLDTTRMSSPASEELIKSGDRMDMPGDADHLLEWKRGHKFLDDDN